MRVAEALDIMRNNNNENHLIIENGVDNIEEDVGRALDTIMDWQEAEKLGEVYLNYYEATGKTITLSIGFKAYWVTLNDIDVDYIDIYEDGFLGSEVDFEEIFIMFEDEGDTFHEVVRIPLEENGRRNMLEFLTVDFKGYILRG